VGEMEAEVIERPRRGDFVLISSERVKFENVVQGIVLKVMDAPGAPYGKMYEVFTGGVTVVFVQGFWKFKVLSRVNEKFNK
jgi:hypothetical protein